MPVLPWWFLAVFVLGVNFVIWGSVGAIRLTESRAGRLSRHRKQAAPARNDASGASQGSLTVSQVAVLMPAHNESAVLAASLDAIMKLVPASNIHVVSDGSTDDTPDIARRAGVQVYETRSNVGKAGALQEAIGHFQLIRRYPVVLLLDADTRVDPDYFAEALPLFNEPEVVAVAGCVRTARDRRLSLAGNVLVGHRERIYAIGQRALKFGQTYLRANATHIVPGFASMYRTSVLPNMEMNPPGLVIEDFNMTFEVYQKRLGKVAFTLKAVAETQDPDTLPDYIRQTRRWAIGLWQTVRRHPPRANLFTAMLAVLLLELITSSAIFLMLPRLLLVGFFFPFLRIIDAAIGLCAIPAGWLVRSNGTWKSPARRAIDGAPEPVAIPAGQAEPVVPDAERTRVGAESAESPSASPVFANFVPEKTHAHG